MNERSSTWRDFWETYFVVEVPEFAVAFRDELASKGGELLPSLMLGAVLLPFLTARPDDDVLHRALACLEAGVDTLYTEDMGAPTKYDEVQLINPFV